MPLNIKRQSDYSGGVNYTDAPSDIQPDELAGVQNVRISGKFLTEREGQTKFNTNAISANTVHSLFRFYKDDGSTRKWIGAVTTKLYDWSATPTEITRSSGAWTTGVKMSAAAMNNSLFIGNGTDTPEKYTSGSATTAMSGSPPTAKFMVSHPTATRLFAAGVAANPKRVYYSALGNPEDWTTANDAGFFDVPFTEGENVTAIAAIPNGVLAIFSNSSFHTLTGTDPGNFSRREIDPAIGCKAPRSIVPGRGGIYFLGQDNHFYWTNGGQPVPVSHNIDALLESGSTGDYVNAVGWRENTRYHCAISIAGGNNDTVVVKDWQVNPRPGAAWVVDKQLSVASAAVDDGVNGQVMTGDYAGFVQQQDVATTDNGVAVASYWDTADDDYGEMERRKKTKRTYVKVEPSGSYSMTVSVAKDGQGFSTATTVDLSPTSGVWDTGEDWDVLQMWGGAQSHIVLRASIIRNCRSIQHRFSISNPFKFYEYSTLLRKKYPR